MNPLRMISTSIVAALIAAACLASSPSLASSQRPATSGTILTMTSLESPNVTNAPSSAKVPTVPKAKIEPVVDNYHGHKVTDPYRWLEDSHSPETQKFVEEENVYTQSRLDSLPLRQQLHARIESLATIGRIDVPRSAGKYYFHEAREGRQNQPVVYVREGVNGHDRPLVDVNSLAPDGTIALDWWHASDDGAYVAYGTSPNGSEISTLQVIETATGNLLPEQIGRTRAADVAWLPDNSGFYYTRYPRPGDVPAGQEMYNRRVFLHKLGGAGNMDGLKDPLIFGEGLDPEHWPHVSISKDGRWLLIKVSEGWTKEELFLKDLAQPQSKFAAVTQNKDFLYGTTIADGQLYIMTNEGAPRYRIFRVSCANPERSHWEEVLPEGQGVMQSMRLVGGKLFVHYFENAHSTLSVFELPPSTGHDQNAGRKIARHIKDVELPALGSITGLEGKLEGNEVFFGFSSYALPQTVYRLSLEGKLAEWARLKADVDPSAYEVKQVWFPSKDGVRVPMFVVHKKGLVLNGKNPTMLSGYGGFNVGRTPAFNRSSMLVLLDHGGVYADVQLRGGSEFGASWHRAGMLEKKQNVFDDFIAAAEYLIAEKYTNSG
ncbi:MAG TPA: prolyl oligopeptidase family serine peptidase, partial [Candidatus Angelobacter sp.]|nr:prolyl oligopeptidase family serine peptidase [Candidatus Angelobacter sp.]